MAGERIQAMSVELSKRIADEVAAYSTDGKMFTSAQRLKALNSAREKLYNTYISKLGVDGFAEMFPEFMVETSPAITVTGGSAATPTGSRKVMAVKLARTLNFQDAGTTPEYVGTWNCRKIPKEVYYEMSLTPESCPYQTTDTDYGYIELGEKVIFFGSKNSPIGGTYYAIYLKDISDVTYSQDVIEPSFWTEDTIDLAAKILLSQTSNN